MSYLTQIRLDKGEAARLHLHDTYAWHQRLWGAFPAKDGETRDFLFRLDDARDSFRVLLLSPEEPSPAGWGAWEIKAVAEGFLEHERYLFQIRANPTIKRVVRDEAGERKKNGRRDAIYDSEALRAWMERKAGQAGFAMLECNPGPATQSFFVKDGHRGKHVAVDFQGVLRVVERDAFRRAFATGIGPAKAFGFGLVMLQPVA